MRGQYILDSQGRPVPEPNLIKWGMWFQQNSEKRIVKQESICGINISTVFLGLDHGWMSPVPILWETMTFAEKGAKEPLDQDCDRCSGNREQAEAMHERMKAKVVAELAARAAAVAGIGDLTDSEIETP